VDEERKLIGDRRRRIPILRDDRSLRPLAGDRAAAGGRHRIEEFEADAQENLRQLSSTPVGDSLQFGGNIGGLVQDQRPGRLRPAARRGIGGRRVLAAQGGDGRCNLMAKAPAVFAAAVER
jgi:hypothetical protein